MTSVLVCTLIVLPAIMGRATSPGEV